MAYTKPGITVEQIVEAQAAPVQEPQLRPAIIGPVYQVEVKRTTAQYAGVEISADWEGLKNGAVIDLADARFAPEVYINHDGEDYEVTDNSVVTKTISTITIAANLEHVVSTEETDGRFTGSAGAFTTFTSEDADFVADEVRVNDYVKTSSDSYKIVSVDSDTGLTTELGPSAASSDETYTIVRKLKGDVLVSYRAARTDAEVVGKYLTADSVDALRDLFGKDAIGDDRNPLGFGMLLALGAGGVAVAGVGINPTATASTEYQKAVEVLERDNIGFIAPLTMDTGLQDTVIAHVKQQSTVEQRRPRRCYVGRELPEKTAAVVSGTKGVVFDEMLTKLYSNAVNFTTSGVRVGDVLVFGGAEYEITAFDADSVTVSRNLAATTPHTTARGAYSSGTTLNISTTTPSAFPQAGQGLILTGTELKPVEWTAKSGAGDALTLARAITGGVADGAKIVAFAQSGANFTGINYSIHHKNTKDQMVEAARAVARSLAHERVTLIGPDKFSFSIGGKDTELDSFYAAACKAGQRAGAGTGQPLIRVGLPGPTGVNKGTDYFKENQLDRIAGAGWQLFVQPAPGAAVVCRDDLTTRQDSGAAFGQESEVVARDIVAYTLRDSLDPLVGRLNVTPRTIASVSLSINAVLNAMVQEPFQPFQSLVLTSLEPSTDEPGRITAVITAVQSDPYTGTDITLIRT